MSSRLWAAVCFCGTFLCNAQTVTFQADAAVLSKGSRQGKQPGELVQITLPGKKFDPPIEIPAIQKSAADRATPEGLLASMRSANLAGDADWIASNFAPRDQDRLRKLFADPAAIAKSRAYYSSVQKMQVLETAQIREYTIMVVREVRADGSSVKPVTMIKAAQGWRATNDLASDPTLDIVWMAVAAGPTR
jgi:hypothetical protein